MRQDSPWHSAARPITLVVMSPHRFVIVDPGHFHAALVQKEMYPGVEPLVHVYARPGAWR